METLLNDVINRNRQFSELGEVASYIPELANADKNALGVCLYDVSNGITCAGDSDMTFTIQSISKVIILIQALMSKGHQRVFERVGMEPSADPFNSIAKLETRDTHIPLNPFINAGAIVCTSMVDGDNGIEKFTSMLSMVRKMANNETIDVNYKVYRSEKMTGNTNRAIAYYLKGAKIIESSVEDVLDTYFKMCSLEVTVGDVAKIASVLANDGIAPWSEERIISKDVAKTVKAIMTTCGLYDSSGRFSVEVGTPAKSGVGGCIMAVVPNRMGMAVIGPSLDKHGNSVAGQKVLAELSRELELSIY